MVVPFEGPECWKARRAHLDFIFLGDGGGVRWRAGERNSVLLSEMKGSVGGVE